MTVIMNEFGSDKVKSHGNGIFIAIQNISFMEEFSCIDAW